MGITALLCLTMAIYYEARSEPIIGQYAVAEIIMNRVADQKYPDTVCAVVKQDNGPKKNDCQFSFYCDGRAEKMLDKKARERAKTIAREVLKNPTNYTQGALFYHADYVTPNWAKHMQPTIIIGDHIFYKRKE